METPGGGFPQGPQAARPPGLPPRPSCSSPQGLDAMRDAPPAVTAPSPSGRRCHSRGRVNVDRFYFQALFKFLDET